MKGANRIKASTAASSIKQAGRKLFKGDLIGSWREFSAVLSASPESALGYAEAAEAFSGRMEVKRRGSCSRDRYPLPVVLLINVLNRRITTGPPLAEAHLWRGMLRRRAKDYEGAIKDFDKAFGLGVKSAFLLTWRGEARLQCGDQEGMKDMEAALLLPCQAWNWAWCGRSKLAFKRSRDCLAYFDRALKMEQGNGWFLAWRAEAKRLLGVPEGMLKDFDLAVRRSVRDDQVFIRTWRGLALVQSGWPQKALADFNSAIRRNPAYALALNGRAQAYRRLGRREHWLSDFERCALLDCKYVERHDSRRSSERLSMLEDLDVLCRKRRVDAAALRWRGLTLTLMDRLAEARRDFDAAIKKAPRHAWAYAWRAKLNYRQHKIPQALADIHRALTLSPRDPLAHAWRARFLMQKGELDRSLESFDQALSLDQRFAWMFCDRGCARMMRGDWEGAALDLRRALMLHGLYVQPRVDLAVALGRLGDAAEERRHLAEAACLDPRMMYERLEIWRNFLLARGEKLTLNHEDALISSAARA